MLPLPKREQAHVLPWDLAIAQSKGIYGFDSLDARSRAFNMIRAKLHELRAQRGWRLFGVVSATPKVGKSFIAANIAASLSRDPRFETTVVDLDLRRLAVQLSAIGREMRQACAHCDEEVGFPHQPMARRTGIAARDPDAERMVVEHAACGQGGGKHAAAGIR